MTVPVMIVPGPADCRLPGSCVSTPLLPVVGDAGAAGADGVDDVDGTTGGATLVGGGMLVTGPPDHSPVSRLRAMARTSVAASAPGERVSSGVWARMASRTLLSRRTMPVSGGENFKNCWQA